LLLLLLLFFTISFFFFWFSCCRRRQGRAQLDQLPGGVCTLLFCLKCGACFYYFLSRHFPRRRPKLISGCGGGGGGTGTGGTNLLHRIVKVSRLENTLCFAGCSRLLLSCPEEYKKKERKKS
jgi:hypothetical protein